MHKPHSIDEGFCEVSYKTKKSDYRETRNSDKDGRYLLGLIYTRNRCGHQRALVATEGGIRLPVTLPAVLGTYFRWRESADLPTPDPGCSRLGLTEYDSLLAGRSASEALDSASKWFSRSRIIYGV